MSEPTLPSPRHTHAPATRSAPVADPPAVRRTATIVALAFLALFLFLPLVAIFVEAFADGWRAYVDAVTQPDALSAFRLTALTALVVVPLNAAFGLAAAWALAHHEFRGKHALLTLIDLPFAVSPVIAGLLFVLLFGANSALGGWLVRHGVTIIFAAPGIWLATLFITVPFVARELIPLMQEQGAEEELAAFGLGAGPWQTFWRVSLPKIKWGLLYGAILLNARAIGEFGAVSVVSGHIRGETNTAPLHVEILYNEYAFSAAFAVASVLALAALVTLVARAIVEWRSGGLA
jgi:sulfate transport system permease protein